MVLQREAEEVAGVTLCPHEEWWRSTTTTRGKAPPMWMLRYQPRVLSHRPGPAPSAFLAKPLVGATLSPRAFRSRSSLSIAERETRWPAASEMAVTFSGSQTAVESTGSCLQLPMTSRGPRMPVETPEINDERANDHS